VQSPVTEAFFCASLQRRVAVRRSHLFIIGKPQKVRMGYASKSLHAEQMIMSWPRNLPANFSFSQKDLNFPGFIQVRISKRCFCCIFTSLQHQPDLENRGVYAQLNHNLN